MRSGSVRNYSERYGFITQSVRNYQISANIPQGLNCYNKKDFYHGLLGGYIAGTAASVVLGFVMRRVRQEPRRAASELSGQDPRSGYFDLNNVAHIELLDEIRMAYATVLTDESHAYTGCMFRPAALLPYPKPLIRTALLALLDFAEGRRDSTLIDIGMRRLAMVYTIRNTLDHLDDFLDVPPEQLPTDPIENSAVGLELKDLPAASPQPQSMRPPGSCRGPRL